MPQSHMNFQGSNHTESGLALTGSKKNCIIGLLVDPQQTFKYCKLGRFTPAPFSKLQGVPETPKPETL